MDAARRFTIRSYFETAACVALAVFDLWIILHPQ
jgi:hypothetical protein